MDALRAAGAGAVFVTADALAARQWELVLAPPSADAWLTPPLWSFSAWAAELWTGEGLGRPTPLAPHQARALWRGVVADSKAGAALLGEQGAAAWAAGAWEALKHARIDPLQLRAEPDQEDFRAFLDWARAYAAALADHGWLDLPGVIAALPDEARLARPAAVVLADVPEPSAAQRALLERLAREGCPVSACKAPPAAARRQWRAGLPDTESELQAAVSWAAAKLSAEPRQRIALVVGDAARRRGEIERAFEAARGEFGPIATWRRTASLAADPAIGAAVNALELLTPRASFAAFGSWLRSPFFAAAPEERAARAMLEVELRRDLRSQLPFAEAYRGGLGDLLRREAPAAAAALEAAQREIGDAKPATPSAWTRRWQRALQHLGWMPSRGDDTRVHDWQAALAALGQLTPITGAVAATAAVSELEQLLEERAPLAQLPVHGIHVLEQLEDIGPGYDAAWVTGFTDRQWPPPARSNPLLPRTLQRSARLPWCTPADARARAERLFAALEERVGELVVSWPERVHDFPAEPSPVIEPFADLPAGTSAALASGTSAADRRARETVTDAAPPLPPGSLRGGTALLNRHARCPVRAFCEFRLEAKTIEPLAFGLPARVTGVIVHRALQLWLDPQTQHVPRASSLDAAIEQALGESVPFRRGPLAALWTLEHERLGTLFRELEALEQRRAPFAIAAVEERRKLTVGEWTLAVRLDRVDRLEDGGIAIVDYKTGDGIGSGDWARERLTDTQVPLYAAFAGEPIAAAVIAYVRSGSVGYGGYWLPGTLPGRPGRPPANRSLAEQLTVWRAQLEALVAEIGAGDTRLFAADAKDALGAYAALTRAPEQLALLRRAARPWQPE